MSEEAEVEVADTPEYSVQDMLDAIHSQNLVTAKANFDAVIQQKIDTALEAEKVSIANAVYNGLEAEESDEEETAEVEASAEAEEAENTEEEDIEVTDAEMEAEIDAIIADEEEESETENV